MNKNIFRNRTIIGAVCILLAVLVCFGITPLFNAGLKAQTEAVRVKAEVIPRGTYITADMVEVYTRGASGMSDAIATSLDEVVGRYTDVELRKNTDVNTGWLSSEPLTQYEYLTKLENLVGKKFGDKENPLLVSVRSGARASMPGMMDTILNLGITADVAATLAAKRGHVRWADDRFRR